MHKTEVQMFYVCPTRLTTTKLPLGLPTSLFRIVLRIMQEAFCQHRPDLCVDRDPDSEAKIGAFQMMKRFYNSAVKPYLAGQLVDQEEANRRAAICATCPKNADKIVEFCVSCSTRSLVGHINQFLTSRHTPNDPMLKTCQICSCDLRMKCWCPKDAMDEPELREKWPDHCWMK